MNDSIQFHKLASVFPLIDGAPFIELVDDIRRNGLREPIVLYEGEILDGRNRYLACAAAGVDARYETFDGDDPLAYVISLNLRRRHLDESQRAMVAARIATLELGANQHAPIGAPSQASAAEMLNVSRREVQRAREVLNHGAPELTAAVERGGASVSAASNVARLPVDEQREIVARGEAEIIKAAKEIRARKTEEKARANLGVAARRVEIPAGKFETIVIDPPWPMQKIERDVRPDQVGFDYPTMDETELLEFGDDIDKMAGDDCHMFMWTTQKFLPLSLELLEAWEFRYVLTMVWHKPGGFQPIGLPQYNCEFVVYGRRGSPKFIDTKAFNCCFDGARREHSRKPDEFYSVIERVTAGPRIDIFSRERREGFSQFGNEATKFDEASDVI